MSSENDKKGRKCLIGTEGRETPCGPTRDRRVQNYRSSIPKAAREHVIAYFCAGRRKHKAEYKLTERWSEFGISTRRVNWKPSTH